MEKCGYTTLDCLKKDLKFKAIMLLSDPVNLEMNIQLMCDLLSSKEGRMDGGLYREDFIRDQNDP